MELRAPDDGHVGQDVEALRHVNEARAIQGEQPGDGPGVEATRPYGHESRQREVPGGHQGVLAETQKHSLSGDTGC